uniref:Uncharacterized protein n=1 Tax=Kalanchoe fedtschenkoi TaxID=63787 RepID=A0A7N0URZ6_KALFE
MWRLSAWFLLPEMWMKRRGLVDAFFSLFGNGEVLFEKSVLFGSWNGFSGSKVSSAISLLHTKFTVMNVQLSLCWQSSCSLEAARNYGTMPALVNLTCSYHMNHFLG